MAERLPVKERVGGSSPPEPAKLNTVVKMGQYNYRSRDGSIENRARKPTKGIRCRLRTYLRSLGLKGKFRTDERRYLNNSLIVIGAIDPLDIHEFEGRKVLWHSQKSFD